MRNYDLIVVGSGSGNSIVDRRFSGWDVAFVEHSRFGGTCLLAGCIPTKMFVHTADLASAPSDAAKLGVDLQLRGVDWPKISERIFGRIDPIADSGRDYRADGPNTTLYEGRAHFVGARRLRIEGADGRTVEEIGADRVVLASGGRPVIPAIGGIDTVPHHTSDTVMRIERLPARMAILGGGYIAAEMAHVFTSLGVEVTLVVRGDKLLRAEDEAISDRFTQLATARWDVRLRTEVERVEPGDSGIRLHVITKTGGASHGSILETDLLLVATGRRPNSDLLDLPAGGVDVHPDGRVVVDAQQRTTADGVWALGDLSSAYQLKHVANHEARTVQHNLLHPESPVESDHRFVPHGIFSHPQIASVGLTETEARASGVAYVTAVQDYADIAYGWALEDTDGFAKLLADPETGRLLGAHIIGPQATTLLQPLQQAMTFGLDARTMARGQYWIHPALPELVENALLKLPLDQ